MNELEKELIEKMRSQSTNSYQIFADFCRCSVYAVNSQVDMLNSSDWNEKYIQVINSYDKSINIANKFSEMFALFCMCIEQEPYSDILGRVYMNLEVSSGKIGQFFTPQHIANLTAKLNFDNKRVTKEIEDKSFITLSESCSGGASLILGFAKAMQENGYTPYKHLLVVANDLDEMCVNMTYLQLVLNDIPAIVTRGNALNNDIRSIYYTPSYFTNNYFKFEQHRRC
ncbi:N-6 DNA Methylase domain protein [Peptoanaerobacter stomatis]|uniref:N-6 DNA Methylase domain protein n=1 Tax=Peptoanaerobacter stomatis TaxID=796937 RepID=J5UHD6_9FIRM|nr:N-6 DNA methylase [Peptoanaerobacter stomatis]EJU22559.1 N-6 DNA Methylase domain protein [Peptoanaerobacter stomatis]